MPNNNTLNGYLNNLLGDDGIKTDITVNISDESLLKASTALIGSGFVITVMVFGIKALVNNLNPA